MREIKAIKLELESNAQYFVASMAMQNAEAVYNRDYWAIYVSLRKQLLPHTPAGVPLMFAAVVDAEGNILSHTQPARHRLGTSLAEDDNARHMFFPPQTATATYYNTRSDEYLLVGAPIEQNKRVLGTVWLGYDAGYIRQLVWQRGAMALLIATGWAAIASIIGWGVAQRMVRPLVRLKGAVENVAANRTAKLSSSELNDRDEIGALADSVETLEVVLKENEQLEKRVRMQDKLAAVGQMVSGVAHEINNPIGGMKNALENLKLFGTSQSKRDEGIRLLEAAIHHIEMVVQALLVGHRRQNEEQTCDPRALDDLFLLLRPDCEVRQIEICWENRLKGLMHVPCVSLKEILMNFLVNATKSMPDGGVLVFRAEAVDAHYVFTVRDTGKGMSASEQARIFEPFFTTRKSGAGLGLWVCAQLVETIGGRIEVESEEGCGSAFTLIIPIKSTDNAAIE